METCMLLCKSIDCSIWYLNDNIIHWSHWIYKKAVFNDFFKEQIAFSNIKIQYRENFQMIISKVIHKQRGSVIVV